ncbi:MAG: immunity 26/phosphotriesterase HocA family protein [Muribaculaceae bacterium]|nr:immunity 26/phosphotriesterase HocA family protein [Muribaculaceae bacterium]
MAKRIVTKIGDVFCVEVDKKYKRFFQYFCNDLTYMNSSVIRVFKKRYPMDYNPNIEEIVSDEVDFYSHTIIRDGIEWDSWYKVGKHMGHLEEEIDKPIFGMCFHIGCINGEYIEIDPDSNWNIRKINQESIKIGVLPESLRDIVQPGGVFPYIEIRDRIKYGYYRYTSPMYNLLRRHPHPYAHSYVKKDMDGTSIYLHFKGEHVVQKIEVFSDGSSIEEEGKPLPLPLFWETNWKNDDFITEKEFKTAWKKYRHIENDSK